jgi:hypothetical protein
MAKELKPIDITHTPDVLRLAEEVAKTGIPHILKRDNEAVAVLSPVSPASKPSRRRPKTKADFEAFLSSFGSWKDNVDVDRFLKDIEESRRLTRPPVEL